MRSDAFIYEPEQGMLKENRANHAHAFRMYTILKGVEVVFGSAGSGTFATAAWDTSCLLSPLRLLGLLSSLGLGNDLAQMGREM